MDVGRSSRSKSCSPKLSICGSNYCRSRSLSIGPRGRANSNSGRVACENFRRGCQWNGPGDAYDQHLDECDYSLVPCPNNECTDHVLKKDLNHHMEKVCIYREHVCAFCGAKGTYSFIILDHYAKCPKIPVLCPNQCYQTVNRSDVQKHVDADCRNCTVPCKFHNIGCRVQLQRKFMGEHEADDSAHLALWIEKTIKFQDRLKQLEKEVSALKSCRKFDQRMDRLEREVAEASTSELDERVERLEKELVKLASAEKDTAAWLQAEIDSQQSKLRSTMQSKIAELEESMESAHVAKVALEKAMRESIAALEDKHEFLCDVLDLGMIAEFTISQFQKKSLANEAYVSPTFYSMNSEDAYNLAIRIETNGDEDVRGNYLSAYVLIREGKYDDRISWPFLGKVTLTLVNQLEERNHHSVSIIIEATQNLHPGGNFGYSQYISQAELAFDPDRNTQYLKDDKLCFRVFMSS